MAIELKMNTKIRLAIELINDGEVNPIVDFDNVRYSIDVSSWGFGMIRWTPFNLTSQQIIGNLTYTYPYAAHSLLEHAILGPSSIHHPSEAVNITFPNFPVPLDNGYVIP